MKKILLSLLVGFFSFVGFSSAESISFTNDGTFYSPAFENIDGFTAFDTFSFSDFECSAGSCTLFIEASDFSCYFHVDSENPSGENSCWRDDQVDTLYFGNGGDGFFDSITLTYSLVDGGGGDGGDCPTIDSNYCVENDLCPVSDNFSQLFINNLEFQSHPVINIEIPDYITWDYTGTDSGFYLYIGSGYDMNYINSIIDINSYRPTSQDFTYMFVSGLTLIFPYIFLALLIIFIWKLIKRIFK